MPTSSNPPLALTAGDRAGIGPDVALAAWLGRDRHRVPPFYIIGDPALLRARRLGYAIPIREVGPADAASVFDDALPVARLAARTRP